MADDTDSGLMTAQEGSGSDQERMEEVFSTDVCSSAPPPPPPPKIRAGFTPRMGKTRSSHHLGIFSDKELEGIKALGE
ncbi:hypothetical protein ACOMHN_048824 [Nucella lapillus]